jgi:DNA-binding LacI/PurR family transcriptional regulator
MNNRLAILPKKIKHEGYAFTSRRHVVITLTQEILNNPSSEAFLLQSEHQLGRRFGVSRVTVRLALSELENRHLIFRKHGKGTFAHGRSTRVHRHIGVLIKAPLTIENRPLAEMLRGVQTFVRPLRSAIILIDQVPEEWQPELAGILSGVLVLAEHMTTNDLDNLRNRKLPFLVVGETTLPGPRIRFAKGADDLADFFNAGQRAAEALTQAFLTGSSLNDITVSPAIATVEMTGT